MSGIGFSELIILFVIGLIVLGPERLPRVANQLGGWIGQARRMTRIMKQQLEDELNLEKELSTQAPALQGPQDHAGEPAAAEIEAKNRDKKNNETTGGERDE